MGIRRRTYSHSVFLALAGLFTWACLGSGADAATYYVASTGKNANSCAAATNPATPKQTITSGLGCLAGGDTLIIKAGTYPESINGNNIPSGSSWNSPTTIRAETPRKVILRPSLQQTVGGTGRIIRITTARSYIIFDGLSVDGSLLDVVRGYGRIEITNDTNARHIIFQNGESRFVGSDTVVIGRGTSDIRFLNNVFRDFRYYAKPPAGDPGNHGFYWRSANGRIEGNEIRNPPGVGIALYSTTGSGVDHNVVQNNYIHGAAQTSIYAATGTNNLVVNNIIAYSDRGIQLTGTGNRAYNNTVYQSARFGLKITGSGHTFKNNILYANGRNIEGNTSGSTLSHNLTADPKFVNAAGGNFRLQPASPAIEKGMTLSDVTTDFDGVARPQGTAADIGAFEFKKSLTTPSNFRKVSY